MVLRQNEVAGCVHLVRHLKDVNDNLKVVVRAQRLEQMRVMKTRPATHHFDECLAVRDDLG